MFSGIFARFWLDLKKVVAFSTTSQLRLICFSIVLFNFGLIIFHIIFHAFSKAMIFIFICFYSKDTFLFSILLDRISLNNFILFTYSAIITLVYSINLILWVFNFGSNTILPIILTYNRKIFNILLILLILLVLISFNLFVLNFNFSLFNSFVRKFLPIILLAFVLTKILSFNFSHLNFNIFNISNFHVSLSNKF